MNYHPFTFRRGATVLLLLLATRSIALAVVWEINVNTVMTPEGRKLEHPTADHPTYYYPYVVGYQEVGSIAAGAKVPPDAPVKHQLAEALASQGYLVTQVNGAKLDPPPAILLVFRWGNISSVMSEDVDDNGAKTPQHNERAHLREMLLVGIQESDLLDDSLKKRDLRDSADDDRYYVTLAAYDFGAYYTKHKTVLLWVSRMSIPKQNMDLEQVVIPLIKTGTPFLGRETNQPKLIDLPNGPEGKVELGAPVIKGYVDPASTKPLAPPPH